MKKTCSLTYRENDVLQFLIKYYKKYHAMPRLQDISEHLGVKGRGATQRALYSLRDKGYISWEAYKSRTFKVLHER